MSLNLYSLVRAFDSLLGQNADRKPETTIQIFGDILKDIKNIQTKDRQPRLSKAQKAANKAEKQNKKSLTEEEFQALLEKLVQERRAEIPPPHYTQCQSHKTSGQTAH